MPVFRPGDPPPVAVVFGASGFLGRHAAAALRTAGWSVVAARRRPAPQSDVTLRIDPVRTRPDVLAAALARHRPRVVVNAAGALWDVTDDDLTTGNITLVERLVDAVATLPGTRLVHLGSGYEYGDHPDAARLTEDLPGRPLSRYAVTKLAGSTYLIRAVATGRLDATVLRVATTLGPDAPPQSLLGGLARQLAGDPDVLRLPPVSGARDVVDVRDVARAVVLAASAATVPPVVNVGGGVSVPLTELVDVLVEMAGSTAPVERAPAPAVRRDAGVGGQPLEIELARTRLGWAPAHTPYDSLHALWRSVRPPSRTESIHG